LDWCHAKNQGKPKQLANIARNSQQRVSALYRFTSGGRCFAWALLSDDGERALQDLLYCEIALENDDAIAFNTQEK